MCGRFTHLYTWRQLHRLMTLTSPVELPARYNVAPGQRAPVVRAVGGGNDAALLRWGLLPAWAKDERFGYRTINARSETVRTAPAFRAAFKSRRCIVPVSGFYEWRKQPGAKRPLYFTPTESDVFALAGLWECWRNDAGVEIETFTILTTVANEFMREIHDRMPVILGPAEFAEWLGGEPIDDSRAIELFAPCGPGEIRYWPVGTRVNSPKNDDASLIAPAPEAGGGETIPPGLFGDM